MGGGMGGGMGSPEPNSVPCEPMASRRAKKRVQDPFESSCKSLLGAPGGMAAACFSGG